VDAVSTFWDRVSAASPPLDIGWVLVSAAIALALILSPALWARTRHTVTIAHEGAHGLAALVTGRRLSGIRLHSDTSGLTVSAGRPTGPGMVLTGAAGYTGPALFGLGAAALLGAGYAVGLLWALLGLLALLLVQIRNWYGLWSVLLTGAVLFAATWWLPAQAQAVFAHTVTWFLLRRRPAGSPHPPAGRRLGRGLSPRRRRRPRARGRVAPGLTAQGRARRRGSQPTG
jgi:hypothetical protein